MSSRNQQFPFHRYLSVPTSSPTSSGWFRDPSSVIWSSPESNDSDQSLNSDELENHIAMETDYHMASDEDTNHSSDLSFNAPILTNSLSLRNPTMKTQRNLTKQHSLQGASSKSLLIGRPVRPIGLKDIDLTNNRRAEEMRNAREVNRQRDKSQIFSPVRQNSAPALLNVAQRSEGCHRDTMKKIPNTFFEDDSFGPSIKGSKKNSNINTRSGQNTDIDVVLYGHNNVKPSQKNPPKSVFPKSYSTNNDEETIDLTHYSDKCTSNDIEVIEIDDDCDALTDTSYRDALTTHDDIRERKFTKKLRHGSGLPSFSDDDDDDNHKSKISEKMNVVDKAKDVMPSGRPSYKLKHLSVAFIVMVISIVIGSIYIHLNPHGLCLVSEFQYNLTGLENDLKHDFYGQHLAVKVLLSSLRSHSQRGRRNKPLVLSLHGWTGTGKNYVSNLIAKHIFKNGINSKFIHKFIIPLHFPHVSEIELYKQQLKDWIIGNVTKCNKGGLFIFDEMDKMPPGVVNVLKPFLDPKRTQSNLNFQKVIFLFLSNAGGMLINEYVLQHYKKGLSRESIELVKLEGLLHKYAESSSCVWYDDLIKSAIIDHFVPFLPLERSHVKQCAHKDMTSKGYVVEERKIIEVVDEMNYFPHDLQIFSVSGCKKVSSKVDVAMG